MKRSPRSRVLIGSIAVLVVTSFVAACGDDDDAATTTTASSTGATSSTASEDTATDETLDTTDASTPGVGSASGDEADYVAALEQNIGLADAEISECMATAVVDEIGFDRIQASGLSPEELASSGGDLGEGEKALTPEQSADLKAAFVDCGDLVGALIGSDSIPDDQKNCVQDAIDNDQAAEIIANQWTNADDSQEIADAKEQASACVTDDTDAATTTTSG
jgi:hypothetical protein